jgi:Uncharacterized protein involved in cytokinesis, contains TGc (transglutaminase/protease-like) domain
LNFKHIKDMIGILIVIFMFFIPANVQANQIESKKIISGSSQYINRTLPEGARLDYTKSVQAPIYSASNEVLYSLSDLKSKVQYSMNNRIASFSITYKGDTSNLESDLNNIVSDILSEDDYLNYSYTGYQWGYSGYENNVTINFSFRYLTTKTQESFVDSKVASILGQIIDSSMSDDEKEKSIHDYIVANVKYDTSLTRYSAYNALSEGKTVCQGYALLAFKMLKNAGIQNKIVEGTADNGYESESHAWNLVNLNGKWYHLDCTWDDPVPDIQGRVLYDYYNITDAQIALDHTWNHSSYPSATTIYVVSNDSVSSDFSNYKKWSSSSSVSKDKIWNIKFTKPFDISTINSSNILVLKEYNNGLYAINDIEITYNNANDTISVKPTKGYTLGNTYHLIVTQNILSKDGKAIPKPIILTFSVVN